MSVLNNTCVKWHFNHGWTKYTDLAKLSTSENVSELKNLAILTRMKEARCNYLGCLQITETAFRVQSNSVSQAVIAYI